MLTIAEYIEREALMRRIKEIHCAECDSYHGVRCRACWVDDTLDYIDSEPAADVAPVQHGRWIDAYPDIEPNPMFMYGICSECGFEQGISKYLRYCPDCGCRMDGGADE